MASNSSEDDMFAASGSLMKDLLADLAVDEEDAAEWLKLEQLERELQTMDISSSHDDDDDDAAAATPSAASFVVSAQQAFAPPPTATDTNVTAYYADENPDAASSAMDAWSLSLQKFTASSLEAEFLQADSARKQSSKQPPQPPPGLSQLPEYDVTEQVTLAPPPGLAAGSTSAAPRSKPTRPEETTPAVITDRSSSNDDKNQNILSEAAKKLKTIQQDEVLLSTVQEAHELHVAHSTDEDADGVPAVPPKVPKPAPMTPQNSMSLTPGGPAVAPTPPAIPTPPMAPTPQPTPVSHKPINTHIASALPVPVAVPLAAPAWQRPALVPQQAPLPPPPPRVVFANPHPSAPPIPATQLASRHMTSRDVSYVVHSILKPILASENSGNMSTYHLQYWMKHHPIKPPMPVNNKRSGSGGGMSAGDDDDDENRDVLAQEMASRQKKAQAWSSEHKTLGSTAKANVARPRALISVGGSSNTASGGSSSDHEQRAAVWKSRIYCDQAYQSLHHVMEFHDTVHLMKLCKCLGVSSSSSAATATTAASDGGGGQKYTADPEKLQWLLKLPKGKILLARVLEQALLPPAVVHVLLPTSLHVLIAQSQSSPQHQSDQMADDRIFAAWAHVVPRVMPPPDIILESMEQLQHPRALSSNARMQCTHALLNLGSRVAAADAQFAKAWSVTEEAFMKILAGL